MTIPDYQTVMRPVLELLADGQTRRSRDVKAEMADNFGLTDEERAQLLPSGRQRVIDSRVGWALTYLNQAGLVERPRRAEVRISNDGLVALRANAGPINTAFLESYPAFREFQNRTREGSTSDTGRDDAGQQATPEAAPSSTDSPQDLVAKAQAENRAVVETDLLGRALASTPRQFELLVIRLLSAMGYGRLGQVEHSGRSGDGGIDGIISQDPLGLDRIYVQAKRFATDQTVTRPVIQGFVGALMGAQGDRGVFITTATFTRGAIEEAERVNARVELIDGRRLAGLMVEYAVGVQPESTVTLYELDEDFFENL